MSLTLSQSLLQIELFDDNVDIEIVETIESTAAIVTRFKAMNQGNLHNLIYKEFRPNWVGGGSAELTWYHKYAASVTPSICPNFYGGQLNRDQRRCFLFLEDISNSHFKVSESWPSTSDQKKLLEAVVDFILPLHIRWWNQVALKDDTLMHPQGGPLRLAHATTSETIRKYVHALQYAFPGIVDSLKPTMLSSDWIPMYEQAIKSWPHLLTERIEGEEGLTLIHGDFHVWNLFFSQQPKHGRLLATDWETYKRGLGVYDLAYLLITGLDVNMRRENETDLLSRYHNGLQSAGISQYSWQACLHDYRLSIIANLFPPLMWKNTKRVNQAMTAFADWECMELIMYN